MLRSAQLKATFLLFLSALPVLASVYFLAATRIIEHRQWQRFERGFSKTYCFPVQEVEWIRPGKEIRIKGRMMDLHAFSIHHGQLVVQGLWDEEETLLHERFNRLPSSHPGKSDRLPGMLVTLLLTPGLPVQPEWASEKFTASRILFPPFDPAHICSGYPAIQLPPPRLTRLMLS